MTTYLDPTKLTVVANVGDLMAELRRNLAAHRGITVEQLDYERAERLDREDRRRDALQAAAARVARPVGGPVPHRCPHPHYGCPTCEDIAEGRTYGRD